MVAVLAYSIDQQIQLYKDVTNNKNYYRVVTGLADKHSFGVWEKSEIDLNDYYNKGEIKEQLKNYEEKPAVLDIPAESFELAHNTIYRKAEAIGQIIITLPALPNPEFICEIDFTASDSWIAFTAPASIKWLGDGIIDGAFVPAKGKRYSLIFYYDGVHFRAVSQEV